MKRKILSLLLTFCLALIPALCVNAETAADVSTKEAQPYHVDLSKYFTQDIFYDVGDDADIGVKASDTLKLAFPSTFVTEHNSFNKTTGIFSASGNEINFSYGYYHTGICKDLYSDDATAADHTNGGCTATTTFRENVPTLTFDLSALLDTTKNNAFMLPDNSTANPAVQTVTGVFSGKPSRYLTFLAAVPSGKSTFFDVTYADGTKINYRVNQNNVINCAGFNGLTTKTPMKYDSATSSWVEAAETEVDIVAFMIYTNDKVIQSIDFYRAALQNGTSAFSYSANLPILAITEIPSSTEYLQNEVEKYINGATYTQKVPVVDSTTGRVMKYNAADKSKTSTVGIYGIVFEETPKTVVIPELSDNITEAAGYIQFKKALEYKKLLDERGVTIEDTDILEKFTRLENQYNTLKPHMVDLKPYFNRDVFAKEGETVTSDWGYINKVGGTKSTVGMDESIVLSTLTNDGIFSDGAICDFFARTTDTNRVSKATLSETIAETPFDLSNVGKSGNNVVVFDEGAYSASSKDHFIKIEGFSGKNTEYLVVLLLHGHEDSFTTFNINYEDGTSKKYSQVGAPWVEQIMAEGFTPAVLSKNKKLIKTASGTDPITYTAAVTASAQQNTTAIYAHAFKTDGKPIKSVDFANNTYSGPTPLLAMTEVVSLTSIQDKIAKLDALVAEIDGDVVDITTQKKAIDAIEMAAALEEAGYTLDADTASKIAAYKKQVAALEPHMVDLSEHFNRDVFGKEGDTVSDSWGYNDNYTPMVLTTSATGSTYYGQDSANKLTGIRTAMMEDGVKELLTDDGIFSASAVTTISTFTSISADPAVADEILSADAAQIAEDVIKTPFDLSAISEDKNAIMIDSKNDSPVLINSGFSGKSAKYLLILSATGSDYTYNTYKVTYTDGDIKTYSCSNAWTDQIKGAQGGVAYRNGEKLYASNGVAVASTNGNGNGGFPNATALIAQALKVKNVPIKSIEVSTPGASGGNPIVAMTEIPLDYSDLKADMDLEWDDITAETADTVIKSTDASLELYNRGYSDVPEVFYEIFLNANIKAKAIKAVGEDAIYVKNVFTEENGEVKASMTLTNTSSENDKDYILVIGAYSENGEKLLNLVYGDQSVIAVDEIEIEKSVSIPVNNDATSYKVFVWETLSSLKPIAAFVK